MKKTISIIAILILTSSLMTACISNSKGADYLYDWLLEHGTLVDGTCLQYSETDKSGAMITLCYDTNYADKFRWHVQRSTTDSSGRTIITTLYLFYDSNKSPSAISVCGSGPFEDYYRTLEYFHNPVNFTRNSPIEIGDFGGSTVNIDNAGPDLTSEIIEMNIICKDNTQASLCLILDWLKDSFCPTADMTMSDFGYDNY